MTLARPVRDRFRSSRYSENTPRGRARCNSCERSLQSTWHGERQILPHFPTVRTIFLSVAPATVHTPLSPAFAKFLMRSNSVLRRTCTGHLRNRMTGICYAMFLKLHQFRSLLSDMLGTHFELLHQFPRRTRIAKAVLDANGSRDQRQTIQLSA